MQLSFDWFIVLENLRRGIMVTDTMLEGSVGTNIISVNSAWLNYAKPTVSELRAIMVRVDSDFSATPFKAKIANADF